VGKPECALPVEVRVDMPSEVGADRLVNTVAAFHAYGPDLIVVDFGTATTFDVVAHDGAYVGGVIAPGVNLSLDALHHAAAHLPRIDVTQPQQVLGRNTVACMQSGIFWGYVGLIEGICARLAEERARDMKIIATGGLSPLFARGTRAIQTVDQDLTVRGLVLIHRYNKTGRI
jgi:type III pantothenate kinase